MILKHDEAEPLELSSGPFGDVEMESLNGRWISQTAMAPAKWERMRWGRGEGRLKRLSFSPALVQTPEAVCQIWAPRLPLVPCSLRKGDLRVKSDLTG